jgi:hypothetical protein
MNIPAADTVFDARPSVASTVSSPPPIPAAPPRPAARSVIAVPDSLPENPVQSLAPPALPRPAAKPVPSDAQPVARPPGGSATSPRDSSRTPPTSRDSGKSLPPTSGAKMEDLLARMPLSLDNDPSSGPRGRSQPLFKARRPKPKSWRPPTWLDFLFGAIPGARMMAHQEVARGVAFAATAIFVLAPAIYELARWRRTASTIEALGIDPTWVLAHAGAAVLAVVCFEALRLVSTLARLKDAAVLPRVMASLLVPSALVLALGPRVIRHAPRSLEALWFGAIVLAVGSFVCSVWTIVLGLDPRAKRTRKAIVFGAIAASTLVLIGGLGVGMGAGAAQSWAESSRQAGFKLLPQILELLA